MNKRDLNRLIRKSLFHTSSAKEEKALEEWYDSMEDEEGYLSKLSEEEKTRLENRILSNIKKNSRSIGNEKETLKLYQSSSTAKVPKENASRALRYWRVAAMLTVGILIGSISYQWTKYQPQEISYSTDYGQTMEIILPDSSTVILNGNTSLRYETDWNKSSPREIFLDGEAFFSVKHTSSQQKFVVHTADHFNVEVLGTEFLVSNRKSKAQVVLNSGKIHLNYKEKDNEKTIKMNPGDLVSFPSSNPAQHILSRVNPEVYSSWTDKLLVLDNTSLKEICLILRENYGLTVETTEEHLLRQKVSGSIPITTLEVLLTDIALAYGVKIRQKNKRVDISVR